MIHAVGFRFEVKGCWLLPGGRDGAHDERGLQQVHQNA